jgi:hypothetical protein
MQTTTLIEEQAYNHSSLEHDLPAKNVDAADSTVRLDTRICKPPRRVIAGIIGVILGRADASSSAACKSGTMQCSTMPFRGQPEGRGEP